MLGSLVDDTIGESKNWISSSMCMYRKSKGHENCHKYFMLRKKIKFKAFILYSALCEVGRSKTDTDACTINSLTYLLTHPCAFAGVVLIDDVG